MRPTTSSPRLPACIASAGTGTTMSSSTSSTPRPPNRSRHVPTYPELALLRPNSFVHQHFPLSLVIGQFGGPDELGCGFVLAADADQQLPAHAGQQIGPVEPGQPVDDLERHAGTIDRFSH